MKRIMGDVWGVRTSFWPAVGLKHLQSGLWRPGQVPGDEENETKRPVVLEEQGAEPLLCRGPF